MASKDKTPHEELEQDTPSKVLKKQRSEGRGRRIGVDLTPENYELLRKYCYENVATQTWVVNKALDLLFEKENAKE